jgi:orotidine-5'-phosphate decarboxylase
MEFFEKLAKASQRNSSLVCVGLDPDPRRIPDKLDVYSFNKAIIEATSDIVCAYKLNLAFYEALGDSGLSTLKKTLKHIPAHIPTIADSKRNDIGNTAEAYASAIFTVLGFDATTVNPYLGSDSVEPFISYQDRGVFILCRTSNPGSADFQDLSCQYGKGHRPLYEIVAEKASEWNTSGNIGLVIGATYPKELGTIRQQHPDMTFLVPGVGAQGGDLAAAVHYGADARGGGLIINSSRQVLYASSGKDFRSASWQAASTLRNEINQYLSSKMA